MISKILKLKKNKLLFALTIMCAVVIVFDIAVLLFNLIHFFEINGVSSKFSGAFMPLNIVTICLNVVAILMITLYLVLRKLKVVN